ncbi:hypothetical protein [Ralstonia sp. SET104]|uniref:hypothetical protein n=1 Tax=Ralstonia sp. SET104 TaxID=2448774 RepID=UPI000F58C68B|nr:hypothetical protein [Ralstonia sp. SET104]GCB04224.1 hypothetical protein PSUB009319_18550 [Ralstonia sp. SET104]
MHANLITPTSTAYTYALLVKHWLTNAQCLYRKPEITYRGALRYSYRTFRERIAFVAEIPKTGVGKINKKALRENAA